MPVCAGLYHSEHSAGRLDRPVIVLIHGAGSSHLMWPPLMRRLAGWGILALDLPGHGRSTGEPSRSVAAYAAQVRLFLAEKGVHQVALVGHSLGGAIALQMALDHPNLVVGLGLISTAARLHLPPAVKEKHYLTDALSVFGALAFDPATPPAARTQMMKPLLRVRTSVLQADWQAADAFDLRGVIRRMDIPAWVAVGAGDRLTVPVEAKFLAAFLPRAVLQMVPHAGHFLPLEQPQALCDGFTAFLQRLQDERIGW